MFVLSDADCPGTNDRVGGQKDISSLR